MPGVVCPPCGGTPEPSLRALACSSLEAAGPLRELEGRSTHEVTEGREGIPATIQPATPRLPARPGAPPGSGRAWPGAARGRTSGRGGGRAVSAEQTEYHAGHRLRRAVPPGLAAGYSRPLRPGLVVGGGLTSAPMPSDLDGGQRIFAVERGTLAGGRGVVGAGHPAAAQVTSSPGDPRRLGAEKVQTSRRGPPPAPRLRAASSWHGRCRSRPRTMQLQTNGSGERPVPSLADSFERMVDAAEKVVGDEVDLLGVEVSSVVSEALQSGALLLLGTASLAIGWVIALMAAFQVLAPRLGTLGPLVALAAFNLVAVVVLPGVARRQLRGLGDG